MRQGDLEAAIANYHKPLKINPDLAEAYHNLGEAHSQLNQFQGDRILSTGNPAQTQTMSVLMCIGTVYLKQAQPEQAIATYRRAIEPTAGLCQCPFWFEYGSVANGQPFRRLGGI
jgi:tetratricopeptide (TPR) repeat protein